ncbi:MAG: hypothetical protein ACOCUW_03270 [Gemmatimonadota bacterium]
MPDDPFRDPGPGKKKVNPFGEVEPDRAAPGDDAGTIEYAAARIRRLKSQVGSEGLTLAATRELLDHISTALDVVARAIRKER